MTKGSIEDHSKAFRIAAVLTGNDTHVYQDDASWVADLMPGLVGSPAGPDRIRIRLDEDDGYEAFHDESDEPFSRGRSDDLFSKEIRVGALLRLSDEALFRSGVDAPEEGQITGAHLTEGLLRLPETEKEAGLGSISVTDVILKNGHLHIEVTAEVENPEALTRAARAAYVDCWGDDKWLPSGPREALMEFALASNANPSPDEMGFEFIDLVDTPYDGLVRYAADRVVRAEPDLVVGPDEGYNAWLERTGNDDSFEGNARDIPGSVDLYEAGCRVTKPGPETDTPEP